MALVSEDDVLLATPVAGTGHPLLNLYSRL
jgi:hypothetical protein